MNGRVYDPVLGRFLSADPFVGDVGDPQEYNRYSYLGNNPLGGTDPSGYFSLKDAAKIVAVIAAAVVTAGVAVYAAAIASGMTGVTFGGALGATLGVSSTYSLTLSGAIIAGGAGGFASGFAGSLLNGGSIGDAFKAGIVGGLVGGATAGLLNRIGGAKLDWFERGLAHGAVQGGATEAMGGQFRHGFYSGFAVGSTEVEIGNWAKGSVAKGITAATSVGGTASALGGGKFANGAVGGAFSYMFNLLSTEKFKPDVFFYDATMNEDSKTAARAVGARYKAKHIFGVYHPQQIVEELSKLGTSFDDIAIMNHARAATFGIGEVDLSYDSTYWRQIADYVDVCGRISILGCNLGYGEVGQQYVEGVAAATKVHVRAATNLC